MTAIAEQQEQWQEQLCLPYSDTLTVDTGIVIVRGATLLRPES